MLASSRENVCRLELAPEGLNQKTCRRRVSGWTQVSLKKPDGLKRHRSNLHLYPKNHSLALTGVCLGRFFIAESGRCVHKIICRNARALRLRRLREVLSKRIASISRSSRAAAAERRLPCVCLAVPCRYLRSSVASCYFLKNPPIDSCVRLAVQLFANGHEVRPMCREVSQLPLLDAACIRVE